MSDAGVVWGFVILSFVLYELGHESIAAYMKTQGYEKKGFLFPKWKKDEGVIA